MGGDTVYGLEGSIFIAGAAVQWLRDLLGVVPSAAATKAMADGADPGHEVVLVPAFVGLVAPYWDAAARGALFGLTRGTRPNELACAALEKVLPDARPLGSHGMRGGSSRRLRYLAAPRSESIREAKKVFLVDGLQNSAAWPKILCIESRGTEPLLPRSFGQACKWTLHAILG
jgi:hypothetical protein